jgi:O-antigen/teichoic acid export membrane protein
LRASLLVRLFERTTGTSATPRTAEAVSRFGPYLVGMVVAKGMSTAGQLLLGRVLEPAEFGRLALVLSTSTLLALPFASAWGNAFVRYSAGQPETTWAPLLRWASGRTLGTVALLALAVIAISPLLAPALGIPRMLLVAGALLGVAMAAWLVAKSACRGREDWTRFLGTEIVFGAVLLLLPGALSLTDGHQWWQATPGFALAYLAGAGAAVTYFARARHSTPSVEVVTRASAYTRFALFTGAANTIFLYADRFAAQHVLGSAEVGTYQIYSLATVGLGMLASTLLFNFLSPLFPQGNRRAFATIFVSGFVRLLPLTLPALFLAAWAQVRIAGFPVHPGLLVLASLSALASVLSGFLGHVVISLGVNGSRIASRVAATTLLAFALAVIPAVRLGGLAGLFILYTLIYLAVAAFYAWALRHVEPDGERSDQEPGAALGS